MRFHRTKFGVALIILSLLSGWVIWQWYHTVPMEPAPPVTTIAPAATTPASSTSLPTPSPITSSSSPTPTNTAVVMQDPRGKPKQIVVARGKTILASAKLDAGYIDANGVWQSAPQRASWLAENGRPAPGFQSSTMRAVITAHVRSSGRPDVFANLKNMQVGDLVTVSYDSGDKVVFKVTSPPKGFLKSQMVKEDSYWDVTVPSRELTLITCDQTSVVRPDGHLTDNLALKATRVK